MKSVRKVIVVDIKDLRSFSLLGDMITLSDNSVVIGQYHFDSDDEAFNEMENLLECIRDGKDRVLISTTRKIEYKNESKD